MTLRVVPLTLKEANEMIASLHRHHKPVVGHRFSIGADLDGNMVGCCVVGRPVARLTDFKKVAEVTRLATDGTPNACSLLYGAAARVCKAMGFEVIQTFILEEEPGISLRASGWSFDVVSGGGSWSRERRHRSDDQPLMKKHRYVRILNK